MENYNIFTVANASYAPFLDILVSSVTDSCHSAGGILVADVGLGPFLPHFSSRANVAIIPTSITDNFSGAHSSGWAIATRQKTKIFLNLLENRKVDHPVIMIDNDVCVLRDLACLIDLQYDIQITKRPKIINAAGIELTEIASMIIFNDRDISIQFLRKWIEQIDILAATGVKLPHETPALNLLMRTSWAASSLNVGFLEEEHVCSTTGFNPDSFALHFKSFGKTGDNKIDNFELRLKKVLKNFDRPRKPLEYLAPDFYQEWCAWCASGASVTHQKSREAP